MQIIFMRSLCASHNAHKNNNYIPRITNLRYCKLICNATYALAFSPGIIIIIYARTRPLNSRPRAYEHLQLLHDNDVIFLPYGKKRGVNTEKWTSRRAPTTFIYKVDAKLKVRYLE